MIIYLVYYRVDFFPKPDLIRILGIPTYDDLHPMKLDLKNNALSIQSNIGGANHGHLGLLMTDAKYNVLSNEQYVCTTHPGILLKLNNGTRVASYKLKHIYNENLQVFHKARGFKHALTKKIITVVDEKYIIATKNQATGQFTGNI